MSEIKKTYELAKEAYAAIGINTDEVLEAIDIVPVSLHCWQGDDVAGFENADGKLTGGIQATGNYPGKATNPDELRCDLDKALSLIPGTSKVNFHANYLVTGGKAIDRDAIEPEHFSYWADWALQKGIGLDFNPTYFSHEKSADGFTLSSSDSSIREFWIEHGRRSRKVGEYFGKKTGKTCLTNIWIPDGAKEIPVDTLAPRQRLLDSLDRILAEKIDPKYNIDAVESKLFGIGSEAYVTGSHEFYMGYCATRKGVIPTLDVGHFHPAETVSSKISALLCFVDSLLIHVSRPVRWDSDHVVMLSDELRQIMHEIVRTGSVNKVHIATDYFDASINRIAAYVIGARNTRKALLAAYLEPVAKLKAMELEGDKTSVLALTQEYLTMPIGAVWDYYCEQKGYAPSYKWFAEVKAYEKDVLSKR